MTDDEKIKLITRNLEEVLTPEELKALIENGTPLKHYIGFEISGKVHLGTGLASMLKIKDLQEAGVNITIFLADWHTWLNKKLDGTLETATRLAKEYFEEALKASALCVGADPNKIEFVLGNKLYTENLKFWAIVIKVAKATTIARMLRSTTIMGRIAGESSDTASLFYPAMQAADIFTLGVNLVHAGTDQRNVHIVARDVAYNLDQPKPIAIHHHLLQGLSKPPTWPLPKENRLEFITGLKMSKSKPDSAVFIHDSPEEIKRKVNNAFCPEGEVEFNPILDWVKHLVFYNQGVNVSHLQGVQIKRIKEYGGDITYTTYEDLEKDYTEKKVHPMDLKNAVAEWLIAKLEPARKYFEDPQRKAALEEITTLTSRSV